MYDTCLELALWSLDCFLEQICFYTSKWQNCCGIYVLGFGLRKGNIQDSIDYKGTKGAMHHVGTMWPYDYIILHAIDVCLSTGCGGIYQGYIIMRGSKMIQN